MRKLLDGLYTFSYFMAGLMALMIFAVILAQVVGRVLGFVVPSANELAGFSTAALVFFGLAPTLRQGGLIRVSLVLGRAQGKSRLILERLALTLAVLAAGYAEWYLVLLALDSYHYLDLAPGLLPLSLWIPQGLTALGLGIFLVALLEAWVLVLLGHLPPYLGKKALEQP